MPEVQQDLDNAGRPVPWDTGSKRNVAPSVIPTKDSEKSEAFIFALQLSNHFNGFINRISIFNA